MGPHGVLTARATQELAREDQFPNQAPSLCILFRTWLKVKSELVLKDFKPRRMQILIESKGLGKTRFKTFSLNHFLKIHILLSNMLMVDKFISLNGTSIFNIKLLRHEILTHILKQFQKYRI